MTKYIQTIYSDPDKYLDTLIVIKLMNILVVFTGPKILFESGTRTRVDPRNALNVLPGPDADPTIIQKLDPNPAGKTQTRLHPSRSAHIAQQMLLSQWTS